MDIKKLNEEIEKVLNESEEDIFEGIIEFANNEGVNVSDLEEYDMAQIADFVTDKLGEPVTVEQVEKLILQDIEDTKDLYDEDIDYEFEFEDDYEDEGM